MQRPRRQSESVSAPSTDALKARNAAKGQDAKREVFALSYQGQIDALSARLAKNERDVVTLAESLAGVTASLADVWWELRKHAQRLDSLEKPSGDAERVSHDDLFGKPWPTAKDVAEVVEQPVPISSGHGPQNLSAPEAATRGEDDSPCAYVYPHTKSLLICKVPKSRHVAYGHDYTAKLVAPEPAPARIVSPWPTEPNPACTTCGSEGNCTCDATEASDPRNRGNLREAMMYWHERAMKAEADLASARAENEQVRYEAEVLLGKETAARLTAEARVRDLEAKIKAVKALIVYFSRDWRDMGFGDDRVIAYRDLQAALGEEQPNG